MTTATQTQLKLDTSSIPAQRKFMESINRELLYSGAFGAGKSRIGCEKGHFLSSKYPGNKGLIIRKTFTDLRDTTMDTWLRYVCPRDHIESHNKQEHKIILKNGSEILFHGMDSPTKVASLEVGWIFVDEAIEFTEDDWNMLLGRLRHPMVPFHQIFGATNPGPPTHWLYKHFYLDTELIRNGTTLVVESDADSNPFTPQTYKDSLNTLKGRYHDRYVKGRWVSFEGLVYDTWDPNIHVLPRDIKDLGLTGNPDSPIPPDWECFRVIDFGFTNPFTCQWWASPKYRYTGEEGKQDREEIPFTERHFVMYREIYYSRRTVPAHAQDIVFHSTNEKIATTIADWDAGDRAILEGAGVPTIKANKDISSGIQSTYHFIGANLIYILENSIVERDYELENDNKPTSILEEFPSYIRPRGKDGKYNPKEDPVKLNDHGMDALRYLLHTLKVRYLPAGSVVVGTRSQVDQRAARNPGSNPTSALVTNRVMYGGNTRSYGKRERRSWRSV